jgi:hypothetical protein
LMIHLFHGVMAKYPDPVAPTQEGWAGLSQTARLVRVHEKVNAKNDLIEILLKLGG